MKDIAYLEESEARLLQIITLLVDQLGGKATISEAAIERAREERPRLETYYDPFIPGFHYEVVRAEDGSEAT